jgi:hypothetical protein
MRRLMILAVLAGPSALTVLATGGCSTDVGPSPAELKAQWEAQNVYPKNYKEDLLAFLRTYLNDPRHIRAGAVSPPVRKAVGRGERYVACVRYNARGNDGKYDGVKTGMAIYVSGKLERFLDKPEETRSYCQDAKFAAFPELARLTR